MANIVEQTFADVINTLSERTHNEYLHFWQDLETGQYKDRNIPEMLMLMVSELAEAMEGHRKDAMDDKLPHRKMLEVEMADCLIRLLDFCGGLNLDLGGAYIEKMAYNKERADHRRENRLAVGGKKY